LDTMCHAWAPLILTLPRRHCIEAGSKPKNSPRFTEHAVLPLVMHQNQAALLRAFMGTAFRGCCHEGNLPWLRVTGDEQTVSRSGSSTAASSSCSTSVASRS
jgi:hypothetical protein